MKKLLLAFILLLGLTSLTACAEYEEDDDYYEDRYEDEDDRYEEDDEDEYEDD